MWTSPQALFQAAIATKIQHEYEIISLQSRHNGYDGVSNHQPRDCLFNRLLRRRSKKASKLRVTGLGEGNSSMTAQGASNAENVSIWWRHHVIDYGEVETSLNYAFGGMNFVEIYRSKIQFSQLFKHSTIRHLLVKHLHFMSLIDVDLKQYQAGCGQSPSGSTKQTSRRLSARRQ